MPDTIFDAFSRDLARQQGASAPVTGEARKRNRNKKKKNNGNQDKIFARCTSQIPACQAFAQTSCEDNAACLAAVTACCDFIGACDFTGFVACFNNVSAT